MLISVNPLSRIVVLLFFVFLGTVSHAENNAPTLKGDDLKPEELKILRVSKLGFENIGFLLVNLENGEILEQYHLDQTFIPASTTKVLTALYALETLGPEFQFETELLTHGKIKDGVLEGDLVLRGTGDPFVTASHLFDFAQMLAKAGIKEVKGRYLYDDSFLPASQVIDENSRFDQTYNASLSALSAEFNRFYVWRYGKSRNTSKSTFEPIPPLEMIKIDKVNKRFPAGVSFKYAESENEEKWEVSQYQRYSRKEALPVRNPSLYTAEMMRFHAQKMGIDLPPATAGKTEDADLLYQHKSKPLLALTEDMLEYSNNVIADLLILRSAREGKEKPMSLADSAKAMQTWLQAKFPSGKWESTFLENGSGLTPKNRISPRSMIEVLKYTKDRFYGGRSFWSLLSISGWTGWVENRLNDPKTVMQVWAKTGSMDYGNGLTGYLLTAGRKKTAFVIYVTDTATRDKLDAASPKASVQLRNRAVGWKTRAQHLQDRLIAHWHDVH